MKAAIKNRVDTVEAALDAASPANLPGVTAPYQEWPSWDKVFWQLKCALFKDEYTERFKPAWERCLQGDLSEEDKTRAKELEPEFERLQKLTGVDIEAVNQWVCDIGAILEANRDIQPEELPMPPNPEGRHHNLSAFILKHAFDDSRRMAFEFPVWYFDSPIAAAVYHTGYWLNIAGTVAGLKKEREAKK